MNVTRPMSAPTFQSTPSCRPPSRRHLVWASLVAAAVLAACGSDNDSADGGPVTTGAPSASATGETVATPPTITEPPDASTTTEPVATSPVAETTGRYVPADDDAPPPLVDGTSDPIENPLPDGTYWSWEYESNGSATTEFVLSQLFTGDACLRQFGDSDEACASDNNTLYEPSATTMMSGAVGSATVLSPDGEGGFDRFSVSPVEFSRLVAGRTPAADAPTGFSFERHPVIITVRDGEVAAVDQVFMS